MKGMRRCADERGAGDRRRRCRAPTGAGPDFPSGPAQFPSRLFPRPAARLSRRFLGTSRGVSAKKRARASPLRDNLKEDRAGLAESPAGTGRPDGAAHIGRAEPPLTRSCAGPRTRGGPRAGAPPSLTAMRRLGCGGGGKEGVRGAGSGWEGGLKYMQLPRGCPAARRARIGPGPELRRGPSPAQAQSQARAAEASSLAHAERAGAKKWREAEERGAEADRTEAESKRSGSKEERRRRGAEAERSRAEAGAEAAHSAGDRPPMTP